jgi:DNA polymerase (family 10)
MSQKKLFSEAEKEVNLVSSSLALDEAKKLAQKIICVEDHFDELQIVGSIRRERPIVRDIDFMVISNEWQNLGKQLVSELKAKQKMKGDEIKRFLIPTDKGYVQADFYRATPMTWGVRELVRTGSAEHNIFLAKYALKNNMQLKYSVGLVNERSQVIASKTEEEVFRGLGLSYVSPTEREMRGSSPVWWKK